MFRQETITRTSASTTLPGSEKEVEVTVNQNGCLLVEEGPIYDILKLNASGCKSLTINGIEFTAAGASNGLDDLAPSFILHPKLAELANQTALAVTQAKRKIPAKILIEVRKVFQLIYEKYHTEGAALIIYDMNTGEFETVVPKQTDSSTLCTIEAEDSQCWLSGTRRLAANVHSHPFGGHSAFLSSTDDVQAHAIPGAPIASFNFNTTPRVGNIYTFGKLECEFGEIPLEASDFCELPDEVFELTQEDRDRWMPIIEERVSAGYGSFSTYGKSWLSKSRPYTPDKEENTENPTSKSSKKNKKGSKKNKKGSGPVMTLEDYEALDYRHMADDIESSDYGDRYYPDLGACSSGEKVAVWDPTARDDDDYDDSVLRPYNDDGNNGWSADALYETSDPLTVKQKPWVELMGELAEQERFDLYEAMCATDKAMERIRDEFFPDTEPVPLSEWGDDAVNLLYQITMSKVVLTDAEKAKIRKLFTNLSFDDPYWDSFLAGLFAIGYAKLSPNAFELLEMFRHRFWKGEFPLDNCPSPKQEDNAAEPDKTETAADAVETELEAAETPEAEKPETAK